MQLNHSPADIIRHLLCAEGFFSLPSTGTDWPCTVSDFPALPDLAAGAFDTQGRMDGRVMINGEQIEKPGVELAIRALLFNDGWQKAKDVAAFLDSIFKDEVTIGDDTYSVQNVSRSTPVIPAGRDVEGRQLFSLNMLVTVSLKS